MLNRFFVFSAVAIAISALAYGLYLESRVIIWNDAVSEMSQLEATHGKCSKPKHYSIGAWTCPTKEMERLREELRDMEWGVSSAESTRNLSYAMVIAGPLIIFFIHKILIGTVIPVAAKTSELVRNGTNRAATISTSTSKRAFKSAAQITNTAKGRTKECPSCTEMIKPRAKVCHHCGRDVV
jgi:hypothetical protein